MRENDEFGHYVPLLRRIIILVAVIAAVPVMLWTITAFVRTYVGPPKIPTFHQLAATASINAPVTPAKPDAYKQQQPGVQQARMADPSSGRAEARATATDARDASPGPKGALLGDRAPEGDANAPATIATKMVDTSAAVPTSLKASDMTSPPTATDSGVSTTGALAAQQAPAAMEPSADSLAAAAPLRGPIPLPRRRPHDIGSVNMADIAPGNVPVPRPRPDGAGPASTETSSGGPIEFIQNLFH